MKFLLTKSERIKLMGFDDRWFMGIGIPALAILANALFIGGSGEEIIEHYSTCYAIALGFTSIYWLSSRQVVLFFRRKYPAQASTNKRILLSAFILLMVVIAISGIAQPISMAYSDIVQPVSITYKAVMSFTLVIMVFAIYEGIFFFTKYRQSLLEQERLAKSNMQAQLSALKQQVNPHFLFNSLNTLANVIPEDPDLAARFVQRLAAVYRRVLEFRHTELVTLEDELSALADYLFLLETRFENKLNVHLQLPDGTQLHLQYQDWSKVILPNYLKEKMLPPLCLQLLVENAVKHNVISAADPLAVKIQLQSDCIIVKNRLHLKRRQLASTGIGQQNIKQRYRLISNRPVEIQSDQHWYTVTLPLLNDQAAIRYASA